MSTEDGLCYSIDCMKRIKGFDSLCLGKTGRAASWWLGGRSVPTEDRLSLSLDIVFSSFL
jgi:hypothetical protein